MIMDAVIATTNNAITTVNSARLLSPPPLDRGFSVLSDIFLPPVEGIRINPARAETFLARS
jgi:hypothetical protein